MILSAQNINKYYNSNHVLKNVCLTIENNDRIGLIGLNGCGKSTLLKILTNSEDYDKISTIDSSLTVSDGVKIGYLKQNSGLDVDCTIYEEMLKIFKYLLDIQDRMKELENLLAHYNNEDKQEKYENAASEYAKISNFFEAHDGYIIDVKINTILNGMGFGESCKKRIISTLSGGEKTRLALAKLLLEAPDLLILDEPTNHLDFETLNWLEGYLSTYKGALLIVSHDRYFLDKLCTRICEIEYGELTSFKGGYKSYLEQKKQMVERQIKEYEQQQKHIHELEEYIARNKVRASTSNMAKSREKQLEKIEIVKKPPTYYKMPIINFEYDVEPPKDVLEVTDLAVTVGNKDEQRVLVSNFNLKVRWGDKLAIVGANGIGKSTILKYLQNMIKHEKGRISWARNVKISYYEQENLNLNYNNTVLEELHRRFPGETEQSMRDLLAKVRLTGENVFKSVKVISGGERAKLCLAIMMKEHGNVLILDEPTNHLDLATKEILEEALLQFKGTIIVVSHDRYLLNKVSDRIVEIKEDQEIEYKGNFDSYIEQKQINEQKELKIINEQKIQEQKQIAKEKNIKAYKNKEQRAREAFNRNEIKRIEQEIELLTNEQKVLEEEILDPKIYADYKLMNEKCLIIEELKGKISDLYDMWLLLNE